MAELSRDLGDLVDGDRLYAPIEMAHIVGLEQSTIQWMCRTGRIEAIKMGTQWRIKRSEIARFIEEGPRRVESPTSDPGQSANNG